MSDYRELAALGSTDIKNLLRGPRQFLDGRQKSFSTKSMSFGTLCHCLLLEKEEFDNRYYVWEAPLNSNGKPKTRSCSEYKVAVADNQGKEIITSAEYEEAKKMISYFDTPGIAEAHTEFEVFGSYDGIELKGKLDAVSIAEDQKSAIIFDLKTGNEIIKRWEYAVSDYGYHLQQYHYRVCLSQVLGIPIHNIRFIFMLAERGTGYAQLVELDKFTEQVAEFRHAQAIEAYKSLCIRLDRTQSTVAQFPRERVPAFDLTRIQERGLPEYVLRSFEREQDNG